MSENESDYELDYSPRRIANFSKYHRPDTVLRPGRLYRGEKKFVGNSSMTQRKDHTSKALTLRGHRLGLKKKHNSTLNQEVHSDTKRIR